MKTQHNLVEKIKSVREEASQHKKKARFHRRRVRECLGLATRLEKQLAEYGIELKIQSQGGSSNGKEDPPINHIE